MGQKRELRMEVSPALDRMLADAKTPRTELAVKVISILRHGEPIPVASDRFYDK